MTQKINLQTGKDPLTPLGNGGKSYWLKWYVAVIGFLLAQVIFYYLITIYFK